MGNFNEQNWGTSDERRHLAAAETATASDFFDDARLVGIAGTTRLQQRRLDDAEGLLAAALRARRASDAKGRALLTLDLATARTHAGDLDHAVTHLADAAVLARRAAVGPILTRARSVVLDIRERSPELAATAAEHVAALTSRQEGPPPP